MKYTGTIVGFISSYGSIYNIVVDDTRCYAWKANVVAEFKEKMLKVTFNWNGNAVDLSLSLIKENYYTGKIFVSKEESGSAFLWMFKKGDEVILKGDWVEIEVGNYDCFIELKPLKVT